MIRLFIPLLLILSFFAVLSPAKAETEEWLDQYVQISIISDQTEVSGGETLRLGLVQNIHDGWHTYWLNPGDSGTPTSITWELPDGFKASELEWPAPQKIPFGPLTNYGYEEQVTLLQNLTLPDTLPEGAITLNGRVDLLVCHDICVPERHEVSLILNGDTQGMPDSIREATKRLPSARDIITDAVFGEKGDILELSFSSNDTKMPLDVEYRLAPEDWGSIENSAKAKTKHEDGRLVIHQMRGDREWDDLPDHIYFVLVNDKHDISFRIKAKKDKTTLPAIAETNTINTSNIGIIQALLFALLGGVILNLMPCVFPVLSLKALSLVKIGKDEEKKARKHGLFYTAGILASFMLIASVLLVLKSGGAQIGWGFHLQDPIIISILIYLVFIIGLNLAGFFEFANPFANTGQSLTQKDDHKGAFFTGVLATLVATPCTAPFMAGALGFALTQPAIVSIFVFLALGFGLALPYLSLCFIPALRSKMPKPGAWMEVFKQFLSFPMFLTAAWLTWVLAQQGSENAVFLALINLTLITFTIWVFKVSASKALWKVIAMAILAFSLTCATLDASQKPKVVMESSDIHVFSQEKLGALLEGNDPIFTNMTAAWCITCKVNERVALKSDTVMQLLTDHNIQYLKGDWTNRDAAITQYLKSFGRSGVPLYVFYPPRNEVTGERPDPIVLPQILTPAIVKAEIEEGLNL